MQVKAVVEENGEQRPVEFQLNGRLYRVERVLDQWYGRPETYFKVLADDQKVYILRHEVRSGEEVWELASFQDPSRNPAAPNPEREHKA